MGDIIPFNQSTSGKNTDKSDITDAEALLFSLVREGVVFDVDPDIVEEAGLIEETAITWQEAGEADEEVANDDESGEAHE